MTIIKKERFIKSANSKPNWKIIQLQQNHATLYKE